MSPSLLRSWTVASVLAWSFVEAQREAEHARVPATLLASAANHAAARRGASEEVLDGLLRAHDVDALYRVAESMYESPRGDVEEDERANAVSIFHALADGPGHHVPSMARLGRVYSERGDARRAVRYLVQAGEDGPHQESLYEAGRWFAREGELAPALAYAKAAVVLSERRPDLAKPSTTETANEGYDLLGERLRRVELSPQQLADVFPYADLNDFPIEGSESEKLWDAAMRNLQSSFVGDSNTISALETSVKLLSDFQTAYDKDMSDLQRDLLRRIITQVLKLLSDEL